MAEHWPNGLFCRKSTSSGSAWYCGCARQSAQVITSDFTQPTSRGTTASDWRCHARNIDNFDFRLCLVPVLSGISGGLSSPLTSRYWRYSRAALSRLWLLVFDLRFDANTGRMGLRYFGATAHQCRAARARCRWRRFGFRSRERALAYFRSHDDDRRRLLTGSHGRILCSGPQFSCRSLRHHGRLHLGYRLGRQYRRSLSTHAACRRARMALIYHPDRAHHPCDCRPMLRHRQRSAEG